MKFEEYGELAYINPEDFFAGPWRILETPVVGEDGQPYDIVTDGHEIRCANV